MTNVLSIICRVNHFTPILLFALITECGAQTTHINNEDHLHKVFRKIQLYEARIAIKRVTFEDQNLECDTACRDATNICLESDKICKIAHKLGNADAIGRCNHSIDTCSYGKKRVKMHCHCTMELSN